ATADGGEATQAVHVWRLSLPASDDLAFLYECLDTAERDRAARLHRDEQRRHFAAFRGALRHILAAYLGVRPQDVPLRADKQGKPVLAPECGPPDLHFSVSHSENIALYAVYGCGPVGIDVEVPRARRASSLEGLIERMLSDAEQAHLAQARSADRHNLFLGLWTLKEATAKATGAGLRTPFREMDAIAAMRHGWDLWTDPSGEVYRRAPFVLEPESAPAALALRLAR
ncbi:MAG TPA: 4'-phosphopantetheinyl transferase superfamily protein, partial [Candidatus Hydrogenedentes bacterium]|nr:4'-phosphopantetheinyl transferase superfamily protein [Candidatus Hydrogenedentota bacterium]